jgi:hypothetical protein
MCSNTNNLHRTSCFWATNFVSILLLSCHTFRTLTAVYFQRMHSVKCVVCYKFQNFFEKNSAPNSRVTRGNRFFLNNYTHLPNYTGTTFQKKSNIQCLDLSQSRHVCNLNTKTTRERQKERK